MQSPQKISLKVVCPIVASLMAAGLLSQPFSPNARAQVSSSTPVFTTKTNVSPDILALASTILGQLTTGKPGVWDGELVEAPVRADRNRSARLSLHLKRTLGSRSDEVAINDQFAGLSVDKGGNIIWNEPLENVLKSAVRQLESLAEVPTPPPAQPTARPVSTPTPAPDAPPLPDLVITRVSFRPANPKVGESTQATIHYRNIGRARASGFQIQLVDNPIGKTGSGGGSLLLDPGQENTYLWTSIKPSKAGKFDLKWTVDPTNKVAESKEDNNTLVTTIEVLP